MACWLYEGMLMFGVVFIAGYLFSTLSQTRHALDNRHALQAFLFVVFGIYFSWFWAKGQTLAMKTWHIRLVDRYGRPVTQARALAALCAELALVFAALAADRAVQALGRRDRRDRDGLGRRLGHCSAVFIRSGSSGTTPWPAPGWSPHLTQLSAACHLSTGPEV